MERQKVASVVRENGDCVSAKDAQLCLTPINEFFCDESLGTMAEHSQAELKCGQELKEGAQTYSSAGQRSYYG